LPSRPSKQRKRASQLQGAAPVFAALGDENRLRIVARLCDDGPQSIADLTQGAAVTRQAITKHLRTMQDVGLVRSARIGRQVVWELEPRRVAQVRAHLEQISNDWDRVLSRLRALVEDER
jgi:DNA-binding transcriptional ArsR family regulator